MIQIISHHYWKDAADINSAFFNTHIGCLGAFGRFWDEISIRILLKEEAFTEKQSQRLFDMFKSNYIQESTSKPEEEIKQIIVDNCREDFLFYRCQDCRDSSCGGIALDIIKTDDTIVWTDNDKITIYFDPSQYKKVLNGYLDKNI